jgi:hypothetical protein
MSDDESPNERPFSGAETRNPFEAPTAHVEDVGRLLDDTLVDEPNKVAAGRGFAWWRESWHLFREATGLWIGIGAGLLLVSVALNQIPNVGGLVSAFIFPMFSAGLMLGCRSLDSGGKLTFDHLFAGFRNRLGRLLMIVLLFLLGILVVIVAAVAFGLAGGYALAAAGFGMKIFGVGMLPGTRLGTLLAGALLGILLMMSMWFAPALVALHELTAFEAMKLSLQGCLRNVLPFLAFGFVFIVLFILACLPQLLGWLPFGRLALQLVWLVLLPLMFCSVYVGYREIFTRGR